MNEKRSAIHTGISGAGTAAACILAALRLLPAAAAGAVDAALGETVHLSGYSYGTTAVYLFLTGPNLPSDGVSLDDLTTPAANGGLTRVYADDSRRWEYDWDTTSGRVLDAGTYTVWITTEPVSRSGLRAGEYQTLSVILRNPALAEGTPVAAVQDGSVAIRSDPDNASVTFDNSYRGMTPLTIGDVPTGTHNATVSKFGYHPLTVAVTVVSGGVTEVKADLVPYTGALFITTDPAGAAIAIDGEPAGISPLTLDSVAAGNHTVSAQLDGYAMAGREVSVSTGGNASVSLAPSPPAGAATTRAGLPAWAALAAVPAAALLFLPRLSRR